MFLPMFSLQKSRSIPQLEYHRGPHRKGGAGAYVCRSSNILTRHCSIPSPTVLSAQNDWRCCCHLRFEGGTREFPQAWERNDGLVSPIPPETVEEIEHMKTVEPAFADVGVHVSWEENLMGPFLYTAIPGGTPGLTVTCVPSAPQPLP
ncbi:hypothetical protein VC83_08939 [Pseudogymnoascus destructans]|uniref:Uncharacterized protein n=1 Tax=Pseudogymnoascus destructans TaxID=655981 RepID=A0A176ZY04_9PEZI|nr:uncharacterized protein VC83_08939 [Pseudogymnoascus destructans]OAF54748.1 hypothetical protein VC83_08939 [Pseudogymnoascus destructans]